MWLNFDGINYSAAVWVNGAQVGTMRGAFIRGIFDITAHVKPGKKAVVAVLVTPQPNPGVPHEHTLRAGMGQNGGDHGASTGRRFCRRLGGTGFRRFATAIRGSGRRCFSRRRGRCW